MPEGWRERLIPIRNENTGSGTGLCLEVHDLAVSKHVAGREKDVAFVASLLRYQLAQPTTIQSRLEKTALSDETRKLCAARLKRLQANN